MCDRMTDGQNDKKFSTRNPEAKCMVCTWLKNLSKYYYDHFTERFSLLGSERVYCTEATIFENFLLIGKMEVKHDSTLHETSKMHLRIKLCHSGASYAASVQYTAQKRQFLTNVDKFCYFWPF